MHRIRLTALVAITIGVSAWAVESDLADLTTTTNIATPPPTTITTPSTTAIPDRDLPVIEAAIDAWFDALRQGDIESAWDLMSGRSPRSLGSIGMLESISTELVEGWAQWAVAENRSLTIADRTPEDQVTVITVRLRGTVTREGMTEDAESIMRVVPSGATYLVSPFEEFGNVANQVNPDPIDVEKPPPPPSSGSGRRIVYPNAEQRLWLIAENEQVVDTYVVSGKQGVPVPGTYSVYSKSEIANAGHDDITM